MLTLYQCTIFFSLALLAITIAIFVFATSMYRGALRLSAEEEERGLEKRKGFLNGRKNELVKKLKGVDAEHFPKELGSALDNLNSELNKIDQSILKSRNKPKTLTARNLVGIPASFLLTSITMSGIAIATSGILPNIMWGLSLALAATGLYFIYKDLSHVESFSGIIDLSTLMEQALDKHRMKSMPILEIDLPDFQLQIQRGNTKEITCWVSLKQGSIAKNTRVRFLGTDELDFPDQKIEQLAYDYKNMRKPKQFWQEIGDVNPEEYQEGNFKIKAPDQPGEYTMAYWLKCDEYTKNETIFKINVI